MSSECEQFTGRHRELCEGHGLNGRPDPPEYAVREFRAQNGLTPLPEKPRSGGPPPTPVELPSIWIRGLNFGFALGRHVLSGMKRRTEAEIIERFDICLGCEHHTGEGESLNCGKCGCSCNADQGVFINKLAWASETCPEGKWK